MSFTSLGEFLAMGGHGLYVWLSYGAAVIMVLYNVVSVRVQERRALQAARDMARRDDAAGRGDVARRDAAGTPANQAVTGDSNAS